MSPASHNMSDITTDTNFQVPKLHDNSSNWTDYESCIWKAMEAKGSIRFVEGTARKLVMYAEVEGALVTINGKTLATEDQIKAQEDKIDKYIKWSFHAQHVVLSSVSP